MNTKEPIFFFKYPRYIKDERVKEMVRIGRRKFRNMYEQCNCEFNDKYKDYGAKGAMIVDGWNSYDPGFYNFFLWMQSQGYNSSNYDRTRIIRKNPSEPFSKDNCFVQFTPYLSDHNPPSQKKKANSSNY